MKENDRLKKEGYMKSLGWILSDVAALAIGGLIGAGVALLVAPQSGRATRAMLYSRGVALRERATEEVVVNRSRIKHGLNGLASDARIRATQIGDRLQDVVDHPQAALSKVMEAVPTRANGH
jgi:gas vesicle protein